MDDLVERLRDTGLHSAAVAASRIEELKIGLSNAQGDLVAACARIQALEAERIGLLQANLEANTQLARVTLKKRNLETAVKEAEEIVIAKVVAWLRAESRLCDCHAREETECACGAWDDYKSKPLLQIAEDLEQGKYK